MTDSSQYLNNPEINHLCDLFLAHLGLDRHTQSYRRIKNAVLLLFSEACDDENVFAEIALTENAAKELIESDITNTLRNLPKPVCELFNSHYDIIFGKEHSDFMREFNDPLDTLCFLGNTFLYVVLSYYNQR